MQPAQSTPCPITMNPIVHSGFLHCGHEFEKRAISSWLAHSDTGCPLCREVCTFEEISDTLEGAIQKANQFAQSKLEQSELAKANRVGIKDQNTTYAQVVDRMVQNACKQMLAISRFNSTSANCLYRLLLIRSLKNSHLNFERLKDSEIGNVPIAQTGKMVHEKFSKDFDKICVPCTLTSAFSSLLLHTLMEDFETHRTLVPIPYNKLPAATCLVSPQEIAREYMFCDSILKLERDLKCTVSGINIPDLSDDVLSAVAFFESFPLDQWLNVFESVQQRLSFMQVIYPFWFNRMLSFHLNDARAEENNDFPGLADAFKKIQVEFLLSTILCTSTPDPENRKRCVKALNILDNFPYPKEDASAKNIRSRLYQLLGALIPATHENETIEENGESSLPLLFHTVHPTALLYAIAELRSELYAQWAVEDGTDYQQQWSDLQDKFSSQGHL